MLMTLQENVNALNVKLTKGSTFEIIKIVLFPEHCTSIQTFQLLVTFQVETF
jgi:hypothetical protein